jgi:molecular chaperone DnaJ
MTAEMRRVHGESYYAILGVAPTASLDEIKAAFRNLARRYHPDRRPEDEAATAEFKRATEAYETLSDPAKRRRYDQLVARRQPKETGDAAPAVWPKEAVSPFDVPAGLDPGEWFWTRIRPFVDARRQSRGAAPRETGRRGVELDVQADLVLVPEEAARGGVCAFMFSVNEPCKECNGGGIVSGGGCPACYGSGFLSRRRLLEIDIPPGTRNGSVLRLRGAGKTLPEADAVGDLYLRVRIRPRW